MAEDNAWWDKTEELMSRIRTFFLVFLLWTLVGMISKGAFLLIYHSLFANATFSELCQVFWYGLRLDIAVAGYVTGIPGLLLIATLWSRRRLIHWLWNGYFFLIALLASLAYVANLGLYSYWGFPLDNTPLLYLKTSPADAMASMTWWQMTLLPLVILLIALVIYKAGASLFPKKRYDARGKKIAESVLLVLLTAALLLPIRGGVGTGTNHVGSVYFSTDNRLNHAAVNPIFSFIEAVVHIEEIGTRYRYLSPEEADSLFEELTYTQLRKDSTQLVHQPNVILIVLESFSDSIMHMKGVTPNLLQLQEEGISFTQFYASSFRTDRALVSIHSGLPAQPSMSVMDMPRKSTSLPSIAQQLGKNGYQTTFYYGGDINYSNMRSYFVGTGFQQVVSDADFALSMHTGKWGVADGPVYERMLADIKSNHTGKPFFKSIMTESSHEPFDVPNYQKIKDNEVFNAFSYADHCLGQFIGELKKLPCWQNTIVAIVPDHLGAYPDQADNYQWWRFKVPFILLGGILPTGLQCHTVGSQIDIPATLLGLLGIDHSEFTYSKDLLDAQAPHFAFFTFPDAMGMVTDSCRVIYDNTSHQTHQEMGPDTDLLVKKAKAYLQKLYDDLDKR
jgi:phosphoglycerol transferase MdoB-like AlkP superfamily enzyme